MKMQPENSDLQQKYAARVAEFLALEAREALNATVFAQRSAIERILFDVEEIFDPHETDPKGKFNKAVGTLRAMTEKSPLRIQALALLEAVEKDPAYATIFQPKGKKKPAPCYEMTHQQVIKKREAEDHYRERRFQEALKIALPLLRDKKVQHNPGMIGLVINCFNKLNDAEHTLQYAQQYFGLDFEIGPEHIPTLSMAARAAQRVAAHASPRVEKPQEYEKALWFAEQCLKFEKNNIVVLGIAANSAMHGGEFRKALNYAKLYIQEVEHHLVKDKHVAIFGIAITAADALGLYEEVMHFDAQLKALDPHNTVMDKLVQHARTALEGAAQREKYAA